MKLAIFDFCRTLVKINSLPKFIEIVLDSTPNTLENRVKRYIFHRRKILSKVFRVKSRYIEIRLLRGYDKDFIDIISKKFFYESLAKNKNKVIVDYLINLKKEDYKIIILSAALDVYLRYLKDILPVDDIISAHLAFRNNICKGKIEGIDPYGSKKLLKLVKEYNNIEWENSYYFTDDYISEINIIEKVGYPFIVTDNLNNLPSFNDSKIRVLEV